MRQTVELAQSRRTSPTTNVRVMSAKHADSRSRGHRSTTIDSPCRDRARAHVVPDRRLGAARDDELVRGRSRARRSSLDRRALEQLDGERLAVDRSASPFAGRAPRSAARSHRPLRPRAARAIPSSSAPLFTRRRSSKTPLIDDDLDARPRGALGDCEREIVRNDRSVNAERGTRDETSGRIRRSWSPTRPISSSEPYSSDRAASMPAETGDPVDLRAPDDRSTRPGGLEVEERDHRRRAASRGGAPACETCRRR